MVREMRFSVPSAVRQSASRAYLVPIVVHRNGDVEVDTCHGNVAYSNPRVKGEFYKTKPLKIERDGDSVLLMSADGGKVYRRLKHSVLISRCYFTGFSVFRRGDGYSVEDYYSYHRGVVSLAVDSVLDCVGTSKAVLKNRCGCPSTSHGSIGVPPLA